MNIRVHYPQTKEGLDILDDTITAIHAELIVNYILKLNCSIEEKQKLLHYAIVRLDSEE